MVTNQPQQDKQLSVAYGCLALAEALAKDRSVQPTDRWGLAAAALADARALLGAGGWPRKLRSAHPVALPGDDACAELTRAALTALRTLGPGQPPPPHALDASRAALVALEWLEQEPVAP